MILNPTFYEKDELGIKGYDLYSRLLKDRIILVFNEINDDLACTIMAQLLYLKQVDSDKPIWMYINSCGGSVSAGLGIYDTMKNLGVPVNTVCVGMCASMGAFLLAGGTNRYSLENGQIMIHQVLGGAQGQASDIEIATNHMLRIKERLNRILAENTGKSVEEIEADTERNNWMFAEEALEYGIIDGILKTGNGNA